MKYRYELYSRWPGELPYYHKCYCGSGIICWGLDCQFIEDAEWIL